jgi:hypothetical protein
VGKLEEGGGSSSLPEGEAGGAAHTHARVSKLEGEGVSSSLPEGGADGAAHTHREGGEEGGMSRSLVPADAAHTHTRVGKLLPLPPRVITAGHAEPPPTAAATAAAAALAPPAVAAATGKVPPIPEEVDGGGGSRSPSEGVAAATGSEESPAISSATYSGGGLWDRMQQIAQELSNVLGRARLEYAYCAAKEAREEDLRECLAEVPLSSAALERVLDRLHTLIFCEEDFAAHINRKP